MNIKQVYSDQILSGEKKSEFREIRPNNFGRYSQLEKNDEVVLVDGVIQPVKYDIL